MKFCMDAQNPFISRFIPVSVVTFVLICIPEKKMGLQKI